MNIKSYVPKRGGVFFGILFVLALGAFGVAQVFGVNITNVSDVSIVSGYRQMKVDWTYASIENTTTNVFAVYRANTAAGDGAQRIALLGSSETSYVDVSLVPGRNYSYAVVFCPTPDDAASVNTSSLAWTALRPVPSTAQVAGQDPISSPHKANSSSATAADKTCGRCHQVHDAAASSENLLITSQDPADPDPKIALCESCHMKTGVPEYGFVYTSLSQTTGHTIKNAQNSMGVLRCVTCHGVHQDSSSGTGALTASTFYKFGTLTSDISIDKTAINAQCIGCHDDSQTWYTATHSGSYPTSATHENVVSVSSGYKTYPTSGTYPGDTVANNTKKNAHANILAEGTYARGDCRYCHGAHANGTDDMLLLSRGELRAMKATGGVVSDEEKTSGAYASYCLSCHNGSNKGTPWAAAANIADSVSVPAGSSEASRTAFLASAAGHRITSANAEVPAGSSLPCYTCHNPHGSNKGNSFNLNDDLGANLTGDRNTCFACHTTSDGYVLGSDGTSYDAVSSSTADCIGLSRTGTDTVDGTDVANKLKLPSGVEAHTKDGTMPCSACHGGVHDPQQASGTGDSDGKSCLQCHNAQEFPAALQYEFTASGSAEAAGWESGYNPHLIPAFSASMGETFFPELLLAPASQAVIPLRAPAPGTYQSLPDEQEFVLKTRQYQRLNTSSDTSSKVGPYCAGCHAWHTAEIGSSNTGATPGRDTGDTLRKNYNSTATANTDYIHTPGSPKLGGLCLSCHNDYLGDDTVGAPTKGPLNPLNKLDSELFNNCFHNYSITLTRTTSAGGQESTLTKTFNANCAKCHNDADPIANPLENKNSLDLKVHYVPGRRLLARIGIIADIAVPATGSTEAETRRLNYNNRGMCFGCHARKGEIAGNAGKNYAGKDWYGQQEMNSAPSAALQAQGWTYDSTTGLAKKIYRNSAGTIIGTQTMNNEATFDDMYRLSTQTSGYPSGDGAGGASDTAAQSALAAGAGMEVSGHQINRTWSSTELEDKQLKPYVKAHMSALRCSECHNTHATGMGAMGTHVEWPLTKKGRVGITENGNVGGAVGMQGGYGTIYPDNTTPDLAIATDGSRLITLNDFWSRNSLVAQVKSVIVAWLQTSAGGNYSATDAETKYAEMDHNGISAQDIATAQGTTVNEGLALEWSRSVDIFCFRCHDEASLAGKAHAGGGSGSHKKAALACVDCHIPTVHGGKIPGLLTDRGAIEELDGGVYAGHTKMQEHQIFRWTEYGHQSGTRVVNTTKTVTGQNVPKAMIYSMNPTRSYTNRKTCSVNSNCHNQGMRSETAITGAQHWSTPD